MPPFKLYVDLLPCIGGLVSECHQTVVFKDYPDDHETHKSQKYEESHYHPDLRGIEPICPTNVDNLPEVINIGKITSSVDNRASFLYIWPTWKNINERDGF